MRAFTESAETRATILPVVSPRELAGRGSNGGLTVSETESESIDAVLSLAVELLDHLQGKNPLAFRVACSRFRRAIDERDPPKESPPSGRIDTDRMTIEEAREFARRRIGFGKYAEVCYGLCPRAYAAARRHASGLRMGRERWASRGWTLWPDRLRSVLLGRWAMVHRVYRHW